MRIKNLFITFLLLIAFFFTSCRQKSSTNSNRVVVAISSDVESLNPLFVMNYDEGSISELLYASLVQHSWDFNNGNLTTEPMLAKSWKWSNDSTSITLHLRTDVLWSDGRPFTANDVVFSFDLYSDPQVQSRLYGSFKNFYVDANSHINLEKTFIVENPYTLIINFKKGSFPTFYDIDCPIIPKHIFEKIKRKNLITIEKEMKPVTDGPFVLATWNRDQSIILKQNKKSFLYNPKSISALIFKIVPDYNSQINQLKNGEVDLVQDIKADDIAGLKKKTDLNIVSLKGRDYDYIGWNNIDPKIFAADKKYVPNKLFGDPVVRTALTYAINRNEILKEFLDNHGQIAIGPVAPIFKHAYDTTLQFRNYNPSKAKRLLASRGWKDINHTGKLTKNGKEFSFTLYYPSGNPRREFAASIIQNNLSAIGIDIKTEKLEPEVFFQKMYDREFNAWMAAWSVPIPLDLRTYWYSDLTSTPMNIYGYKDKTVDLLLDKIEKERSGYAKDNNYKKIQKLIYNDEPVTFLYWIDNIIGYNKRIENMSITPLGPLHRCWDWSIKNKF
jgi:peptide/nickel transport system substrate-binding protein